MESRNNEKVKIDVHDQTFKLDENTEKQILKTLKKCARLWKEKNYSELIRFSKESLKKFPENPKGEGHENLSGIYCLLASAIWETDKHNPDAKTFAIKAAHFYRLNKNVMWLIREINGNYSDKSQYMKVQAVGKMIFNDKGNEIIQNFKTIYAVVAENKTDALSYILEFERPEASHSLKIIKGNTIESKPDLPKGVYETMRLVAQLDEDLEQ